MAKTSMPWDGTGYFEDDWRSWTKNYVLDGVVPSTLGHFSVTTNGSGLDVQIAAGECIGRSHLFKSTAAETANFSTADPTNPRIDLVVIRFNFSTNSADFLVIGGTPAASPNPPGMTRNDASSWDIPLAEVRIGAAAVNVVTSDITDVREWSNSPYRYAAAYGVTPASSNNASSLNTCISTAPSGTIILLPLGRIRVTSQITAGNTGVTLKGYGKGKTVITGAVVGNIINTQADDLVFEDMTIENTLSGTDAAYPIRIDSLNITIRRCELSLNPTTSFNRFMVYVQTITQAGDNAIVPALVVEDCLMKSQSNATDYVKGIYAFVGPVIIRNNIFQDVDEPVIDSTSIDRQIYNWVYEGNICRSSGGSTTINRRKPTFRNVVGLRIRGNVDEFTSAYSTSGIGPGGVKVTAGGASDFNGDVERMLMTDNIFTSPIELEPGYGSSAVGEIKDSLVRDNIVKKINSTQAYSLIITDTDGDMVNVQIKDNLLDAAVSYPATTQASLYVGPNFGAGGESVNLRAEETTVGTFETRASASYGALTTAQTVTVDVPTSGELKVTVSAKIESSTTGDAYMSFTLSGANTLASSDANAVSSYGNGAAEPHSMSRVIFLPGLNPGTTTVTAQFRSAAGTASFGFRDLLAEPLP